MEYKVITERVEGKVGRHLTLIQALQLLSSACFSISLHGTNDIRVIRELVNAYVLVSTVVGEVPKDAGKKEKLYLNPDRTLPLVIENTAHALRDMSQDTFYVATFAAQKQEYRKYLTHAQNGIEWLLLSFTEQDIEKLIKDYFLGMHQCLHGWSFVRKDACRVC